MAATDGYLDMLGIEPSGAQAAPEGRVRFGAATGRTLRNPDMHVHGGVLASLLAEGLVRAGVAAGLGPGVELAEMRVAYLTATAADRLDVEAWVRKRGRRLAFASARVLEDGREVASGDGVLQAVAEEDEA